MRRASAGFTLVELLVALLLSLILAVAILKVQTKMASQSMRVADTGTRDTQTRAAMDLITRDLTGAGFLFGNGRHNCDAIVTYNSTGTSYFAHHPVDSLVAVNNTTMTFAPTLKLNYPSGAAATAGTASDVLLMVNTTASTSFNSNAPIKTTTTSLANPLSTGIVPMNGSAGLVLKDAAIMQLPLSGANPCIRVPVDAFTLNTLTSLSGGTIMPTGSYAGFVSPLTSAGFATLTNVSIFNSYVTDIGSAATSTQVVTAYYIDGSGPFPVLMRAQYSLADDSAISPPQPIAAGIVALRVSYGVDPGNTGSVTAYEEAATVTTSNHWGAIRSVRVALVTRTINDDPNSDYTLSSTVAPSTTSIPIPVSAPTAWFAAIKVPASKHRYTVNTTEVAYRDWLWNF